MRVCIIGPVWPYRGGISHHTAILAEELQKQGIEVFVISFLRQYPRWLYPGRTDRDNSHEPLMFPADYILDPLSPITWLRAVRKILTYNPDLVAVQWWTVFWSLPYIFIASRIRAYGIQISFLVHNVSSHESHWWDRIMARLTLKKADNYLTFSKMEFGKLKKLFPDRKIVLSMLPVYRFENGNNFTKSSARTRLGLPIEPVVFLFFGFVRPYKGLLGLLDAMGILRDKGYQPILAVVGEFWHDKQLYLDKINYLGLGDLVRIEDRYVPNEEAAEWFTASDALIAPYVEGVTQSAVASLALGYKIPIIATPHVANGLGFENPSAIKVVPMNDPLALANVLKEFMEIPPKKTSKETTTNIEAIKSFMELIN